MLQSLRLIVREAPWFLPIAIPLGLVAGALDGISIALILPLLESLNDEEKTPLPAILAFALGLVSSHPTTAQILALVFGIVTLKSAVAFGLRYSGIWVAHTFESRVRQEVFRDLIDADWEALRDVTSGRVQNVVLVETTRSKQFFIILVEIITSFVFVLAYLVLGFLLLPAAMAVAVMASLLVGVVYVLVNRKVRVLGSELTATNFASQDRLQETLHAVKFIKTLGNRSAFGRVYGALVQRIAKNQRHFGALSTGMRAASEPLSVIVISAVALYHIGSGGNAAALITILAILFRMYSRGVTGAINVYQLVNVWPALTAIELLRTHLAEAREKTGQIPFERLESGIFFKNVDFAYVKGQPVLSEFNLQVSAKRTTALIGPSGMGKSTILDMMLGLLRPSHGVILLDRTPLDELDLSTYRQRVAMVPQEPVIFNDSIADNIRVQRPDASDEEVRKAARFAHADVFIEQLPEGYESNAGERGKLLSGGQKQRIALARALLVKPEILILDEATSALDHNSERQIKDALRELQGQMTIVIVAHRLSTIEHADVIYRLEGGRAVELSRDEFAKMRQVAG